MSRNRLTHRASDVQIADLRETPAMLAHNCDLLIKSIRKLLPNDFEYTYSTRERNLDHTLCLQYKLHELLSMWPKLVKIAGNPKSRDASTSQDLLKSVTSILDDYRDQLPSLKSIYYRPATEHNALAHDLGILTAHSHTYLRTNQLGLQLGMIETYAWLKDNAATKLNRPRSYSNAVALRIEDLTFRQNEADRLAAELRRELEKLRDRHAHVSDRTHTSDRNMAQEIDIDNDLESYESDARKMRNCIMTLENAHDDANSAQRERVHKARILLSQLRTNITAQETGYDQLSAQLADAKAAIAHAYSPHGHGELSDDTRKELESTCDKIESRLRTEHLALALRPLMARYAPPDPDKWNEAYPDHALLFAQLKSLRAGVEAIKSSHWDCCKSGQAYLQHNNTILDNLTLHLLTKPELRRLLQSEFDDMNAKTRTTCTPKPNVKHLKLRLERLEAFVKSNMSHAKHDDDEYKQWLDLRRRCLDLSSRLVVKKQLPKKQ